MINTIAPTRQRFSMGLLILSAKFHFLETKLAPGSVSIISRLAQEATTRRGINYNGCADFASTPRFDRYAYAADCVKNSLVCPSRTSRQTVKYLRQHSLTVRAELCRSRRSFHTVWRSG